MPERNAKEVGDELSRLMTEHLENLKKRVYTWVNEEEYRQEEERLRRIRELSSEYLAALRRTAP